MSAFHCRSYLLLQKELFKLQRLDLWGIEVELVEENLFLWKIKLSGLKDTLLQDAQFVVFMKFSEHYDIQQPFIWFQTIPFHPNINEENGAVCIGCILEWKESNTLANVLLSIQQLLHEPVLQDVVNEHAANMFINSPEKYKRIILDCVRNTYLGIDEFNSSPSPGRKTTNQVSEYAVKQDVTVTASGGNYKLSYEDYLNSWKSMGTTKTSHNNNNNPFVDILHHDDAINKDEYDVMKHEVDDEVSQQLSEQQMLMYGCFGNDLNKCKREKLKKNKIRLLKDIHGNKDHVKSLRISLPHSPTNEGIEINKHDHDVDEIDVVEAKELLEWTQNLPN